MDWDVVIGLETHVQLNTKSKIFSGSSTQLSDKPNIHAGIVEMAFPGALPVLNKEVLHKAIKLALAINAKINQKNVFDRKNYFYPDLPKAYQISQLELPIMEHGNIDILVDDQIKTINITRAHIEEDAGKSVHDIEENMTAIDLNRTGIPLIEIVSEPELSSAKEGVLYAKILHNLVVWLDICDGNMAEGNFRVDANVSLKPRNSSVLGTRCEIKNINSFKFLEQAINYEIGRQKEILEEGGKIIQQTRLFNHISGKTIAMRSKEDAHDYRYFPDPDLYPVWISEEMIEKIRKELPELPSQKAKRFQHEYGLSEYDANLVTASLQDSNYFESVVKIGVDAKIAANWQNGELAKSLNKETLTIDKSRVGAAQMAGLLKKICDKTLTSKLGKKVFEEMWNSGLTAEEIIEKQGIQQMTDVSALEKIIDDVIQINEKSVNEFKLGKEKALNALVGQVMKLTKGQANPQQVLNMIKAKLS